MVQLQCDPGDDWETFQSQLNIQFGEDVEPQKHYERVAQLWESSQEYRERVDDLFEANQRGEPIQDYREAAASAGEELRDTIGEGSIGVVKLCEIRDSIFRAINKSGRTRLVTSSEYDEEEILDAYVDGYRLVMQDMYVPAIRTARYKEDQMYQDQTLLERAWEAENERVFKNRLEQALKTIQSNPQMNTPEVAQWAESLLNHLRFSQ